MSLPERLPRGFQRLMRRKGRGDGTLMVPASIAEVVPEDTVFAAELTDDGILFRVTEVPQFDAAWIRANVRGKKSRKKEAKQT